MRALARRSIVALRAIPHGSEFTVENVGLRRPGNGMPPGFLDQVMGNRASRDIPAGAVLSLGDLGK